MNKTICKYPLEILTEQVVQLPLGYCILTVQKQNSLPNIWALVDKEQKHLVDVKVVIYATGDEFPDDKGLNYQGTFQMLDGMIVYHVFTDDGVF